MVCAKGLFAGQKLTKRLKAAELYTHTHTHTHTCNPLLSLCATKLIFVILVVCAGIPAMATTDIQPNGNLSGGDTAANCTQPVLGTYSGSTNFEAKWRANSVPLKWYNEGALLDVQDAADTCTYDGALNIPSVPPTKTGYVFDGWKVRRLPTGYTELEYVEGGAQLDACIDLGFPPTPTMQTLLTASISTTGDEQIIFGASDDAWFRNGNAYAIDILPSAVLLPNGKYVTSDTVVRMPVTIALDTIYQYKINYPTIGTIGVNNTAQAAYTNLTTVATQNLYVFTYRYNHPISIGSMKLYGLALWDNNRMIHNYIPAKRNSDNAIGIFDKVTQAFLTSYTNPLGAGPEIN